MGDQALRVPKKLKTVEAWIHPEGRVVGAVYLRLPDATPAQRETPEAVLNGAEPFLVLRCEAPDELRFYSKKSIVRLYYHDEQASLATDLVTLRCQVHLMDGAVMSGEIREALPPARRRLFDYINSAAQGFVRLHLETGDTCLINKAYIVRVSPPQGDAT